jgi:hypothetical protein
LIAGLIACGGSGVPAGTTQVQAPAAIAVPRGAAPSINGVVAADEWAAAHPIEIGAGAHKTC